MIITSLNNPTIKEISKLKNKKYRDLTNTYLVEGDHLVEEAYKNNLLIKVHFLFSYELYIIIHIILN